MKKLTFLTLLIVLCSLVPLVAEDYFIEGKLGIGVDSPGEDLEVEGSIKGDTLIANEFKAVDPNGIYQGLFNCTGISFSDQDNTYFIRRVDGELHLYRSFTQDPAIHMILNQYGIRIGRFPEFFDSINNDDNDYKLAVDGVVLAKEVQIKNDETWPDFVFEKNYNLLSLNELEEFININKHLPELPTKEEVADNGIGLGEMQAKLLQKVEELTLYMIELKKENNELRQQIENLSEK